MIFHDVEQGGPEWLRLRCGIPTASNFHRILTPKRRKMSGQVMRYMRELLAERLTGEPSTDPGSPWLDRGTDMEAEARRWYEYETGHAVAPGGFVTADDGRVGGSPDGWVKPNGLVEFKVRSAPEHIRVMLDADDPGASQTQVQGLLWLTGRAWCDVVNYNPRLTCVIRRVHADADYIADLSTAVLAFADRLDVMVSDVQ